MNDDITILSTYEVEQLVVEVKEQDEAVRGVIAVQGFRWDLAFTLLATAGMCVLAGAIYIFIFFDQSMSLRKVRKRLVRELREREERQGLTTT
jgi:hypothetical protein